MRKLIFFAMVIGLSISSCCKDKDPKITKTEELSEEMFYGAHTQILVFYL
jgi:hypothetical protein